jgi:Flp pilus assembly secretin CpaC
MAARVVALSLGVLLSTAAPTLARASPPTSEKAPPADATITLKRGAKHVLTVPGLSRVALGDPDVADVATTGKDGVKLTARKKGETTLMTWDEDGKRRTWRVVVKG